jgi:hypothetical protein
MIILEGRKNQSFLWRIYTEQDILLFNDQLLTPGKHSMHVPSMVFGRKVLKTLLVSLNCYTNIAFLSIESYRIEKGDYANLYDHLQKTKALESDWSMSKFFAEEMRYDFLWIEESQELQALDWYPRFMVSLQDFNVTSTIPIVFLRK